MTEQYLIYLRKSRNDMEAERAGGGETLARHEKELLALADRQHLTVGAVYREIVSGETIAARPMIQKLLAEVESGMWSGVIVMEIERLARGATKDQGIVAEAFKFGSTRIITPAKTYDPDNEFDEEYFEFGLFMSRREYKTINRRIQRGRIASLEEGKYIASSPPYGYTKVKIPDGKGYTLSILPEEAEIIQLIYRLYTQGLPGNNSIPERLGYYRIANYLNSLHIPPRKNISWSSSSIRDILSNPVYIGKIRWRHRKEYKKVIGGTVTVSRQKNCDYVLYDGLHEAIVDEETYRLAQSFRTKKDFIPINSRTALLNPLSGLIYCEQCGHRMTRSGANKRNKYDTLRCPAPGCDNICAPLYLVEKSLIDGLSEWFSGYRLDWNGPERPDIRLSGYPPADGRDGNRDTKSRGDDHRDCHDTAIRRAKSLLGQLKKQLLNTYDLLERGVYTDSLFHERQQEINTRIRKTSILLADLESHHHGQSPFGTAHYHPPISSLTDVYHALPTADAKNAMLKLVLVKVTYLKTVRSRKHMGDQANFHLKVYPAIPCGLMRPDVYPHS